jgi:hypothetical protein
VVIFPRNLSVDFLAYASAFLRCKRTTYLAVRIGLGYVHCYDLVMVICQNKTNAAFGLAGPLAAFCYAALCSCERSHFSTLGM